VASQIVLGLQTIASRQIDVTLAPAIITIGAINGGIRFNIIPDEVEMIGTIRAFDTAMLVDIHDRIRRTATSIAESAGASAEVEITSEAPVTYNDPELTRMMTPTVQAAVGRDNTVEARRETWAEDFACYQQEIPGLFVYLGVRTPGANQDDFPSNHSPRFMADEDAMITGVRLLSYLAVDYLALAR
jgi:amidohydrolase